MLRVDLGDDVFFKAWRKAFRDFDPEQDGFDILRDAFSATAGRDLSRFFDQWFFMAGIPKIKLDFEQAGKELKVTLRQVQPGQPFELNTSLLVRGANGETLRAKVRLADSETTTRIECDFHAKEVVLDPDDVLLKEMVE
jgi:aminopeptidase N